MNANEKVSFVDRLSAADCMHSAFQSRRRVAGLVCPCLLAYLLGRGLDGRQTAVDSLLRNEKAGEKNKQTDRRTDGA